MAVTTLTSSEFDQDVGVAKQVAKCGPVFITDNGRPTHVLLTIEDYQRLTGTMSLAEALDHPASADFDFEPPRLDIRLTPADLE
jgi:prevent-host-death family protein